MKLNRDLREFVGLLNSHKVEFLVVGAHALAYHGLPRYTKDIDLFVAPRKGNADSVIRAIDEFGFASVGPSASDFLTPDIVVQLGVEPYRLDLLTGLSGITWDENVSPERSTGWTSGSCRKTATSRTSSLPDDPRTLRMSRGFGRSNREPPDPGGINRLRDNRCLPCIPIQ